MERDVWTAPSFHSEGEAKVEGGGKAPEVAEAAVRSATAPPPPHNSLSSSRLRGFRDYPREGFTQKGLNNRHCVLYRQPYLKRWGRRSISFEPLEHIGFFLLGIRASRQ